MDSLLESFLKDFNIKNKTVITGLSGGADSCVLTYILNNLKEAYNLNIVAAHLNHNWRKEESKSDEDFSRSFAQSLGIEFYTETLPLNVKQNEITARELRYDFFKRSAQKYETDVVFLAHNKNDNVETLLYRIIKGTGPSGLASIPVKRDIYYRPLINTLREDIDKYAIMHNIKYIVDSSNFDTKYKRNYIRHNIIPMLCNINPEFINNASRLIDLSSGRNEIIGDNIEEIKKKLICDEKVSRSGFLKLKKPLMLEFLNSYLKDEIKTRDYKTISKILYFIGNNSNSMCSLGSDLFLKIEDDYFYKYKRKEIKADVREIAITKEGVYKFSSYIFEIKKVNKPTTYSGDKNVRYVKLNEPLNYTIRCRKEGDTIQPFGMKDKQKLKSFLINKKIPQDLRYNIPMLARDNEVLFIAPNITSEKLRVTKDDKYCYKISIKFED